MLGAEPLLEVLHLSKSDLLLWLETSLYIGITLQLLQAYYYATVKPFTLLTCDIVWHQDLQTVAMMHGYQDSGCHHTIRSLYRPMGLKRHSLFFTVSLNSSGEETVDDTTASLSGRER